MSEAETATGTVLPAAEAAALQRDAQTLEDLLGSPDAFDMNGIFVSQSRVLEEIAAKPSPIRGRRSSSGFGDATARQ